jgi:hypothetical protein
MKKSKIFLRTTALVLTVGAVFATKANKKFVGPNTAYRNTGGTSYAIALGGCATTASLLTETTGGTLAVVNGQQLYYHISGTNYGQLYFK